MKNRSRANLLGQPLGHKLRAAKNLYSVSGLQEHLAEEVPAQQASTHVHNRSSTAGVL